MTTVFFNGSERQFTSVESFASATAEYARISPFELCLSVPDGPSIIMLRNAESAFLMFMRHPGDSGFTSVGSGPADAQIKYTLSNGQVDEYPQSWCVSLNECFRALTGFFATNGQRPGQITWQAT